MSRLPDNWRIVLLAVLLVASFVVVFVPGAAPGGAETEGPTNLQYGIQLSGGTTITAPISGVTAEGVDVGANDSGALERDVANDLGLDPIDVTVRPDQDTVEVFADNVTRDQLRTVLTDRGYDPGTVRTGVTGPTRQDMVATIEDRISASALSGGSAQIVRAGPDQYFIRIAAPDRSREELIDLVSDRGIIRMYATYPTTEGTGVEQVLLGEDIAGVGQASRGPGGTPGVRVTLSESAADSFQSAMREHQFTQDTTLTCRPTTEDWRNTTQGRCWVTTLNGDVIFAGGVQQGLAQQFASGSFTNDPTFTMTARNMSEARELEVSLKSGSLPASLDFQNATSSQLEPALASQFKQNALIVGLLAVLAVSLVVAVRYGDLRVAVPMVFGAVAEVALLLGFVAVIQYPLNLAHLAGFVAVIGTGVDDLIIIADEIIQEDGVATGRVFQNRFRKAFWIIGAAAATTIVAMGPLTILPLGDLSGFAIITIVGVLIGVLITRPAYGDILRYLVLVRGRDDGDSSE